MKLHSVNKEPGWMPVHLEIKTRHSTGGSPVYIPAGSTVRKLEFVQ